MIGVITLVSIMDGIQSIDRLPGVERVSGVLLQPRALSRCNRTGVPALNNSCMIVYRISSHIIWSGSHPGVRMSLACPMRRVTDHLSRCCRYRSPQGIYRMLLVSTKPLVSPFRRILKRKYRRTLNNHPV